MHREEVVRVSPAGELHAAGLVVGVDHRQLPEEGPAAALVVAVVAVALGNDGSVDAVTLERGDKFQFKEIHKILLNKGLRDGDRYDDVVELQVFLFQLVLDVDVAASLAVVRRPAVDWGGGNFWATL